MGSQQCSFSNGPPANVENGTSACPWASFSESSMLTMKERKTRYRETLPPSIRGEARLPSMRGHIATACSSFLERGMVLGEVGIHVARIICARNIRRASDFDRLRVHSGNQFPLQRYQTILKILSIHTLSSYSFPMRVAVASHRRPSWVGHHQIPSSDQSTSRHCRIYLLLCSICNRLDVQKRRIYVCEISIRSAAFSMLKMRCS